MTDHTFHIISLLKKELYGNITAEEKTELQNWRAENPGFSEELNDYSAAVNEMFLYNKQTVANKIAEKYPQVLEKTIDAPYLVQEETAISFDRESSFRKITFKWIKYAAAILIIAGIGAYLWNTFEKDKPLITQSKPVPVKKDILPGSNRAILTLSDGKNIELDSSGKLIYGADGKIKDAEGFLIYREGKLSSPFEKGGSNDARSRELAGGFNTMSTPKGGQYQVTLSDGTKVWLNAASSITYPTSFTEKIREVSISGEAYFEVKSIKEKPFIVHLSAADGSTPRGAQGEGGFDITVLGTSFNVNAYPDETPKTSLIEGSVKIEAAYAKASAGEGKILTPGQAFTNGKIINTNIAQDIAWKNGKFNFDGLSFQQAMRMLSRWYDVDIIYERGVPDIEIAGEIGRDLSLAQLLDGLKDLDIHYRVEGRKLIIQP